MEPEQLVLQDLGTSQPLQGLEMPAPRLTQRTDPVAKLQFNLGPLGSRLREHAERTGIPMAVLVRRATLKLLEDEHAPVLEDPAGKPFEHAAGNVHFHLNLPAACSLELTRRARAADMTRGEFVWWLLKGISPPAVPPDHKEASQALRDSTDRLATLSTDLSEFLRLLTRSAAGSSALEPYRATLRSLNDSVREHMKVASVLIAELKPYRRARW